MPRLTPPTLALCVLFGLLGCATSAVTLDDTRGIHATHFGGLPDETRICAVLTNRGESTLGWLRLRLRAHSDFQGRRGRFTSHWVWNAPLAPGQSVALALENPPAAPEIELTLVGSGSGRPPRGRPLHATAECSEAALTDVANAAREQREASGLELRSVIVRGRPDPSGLIASD